MDALGFAKEVKIIEHLVKYAVICKYYLLF